MLKQINPWAFSLVTIAVSTLIQWIGIFFNGIGKYSIESLVSHFLYSFTVFFISLIFYNSFKNKFYVVYPVNRHILILLLLICSVPIAIQFSEFIADLAAGTFLAGAIRDEVAGSADSYFGESRALAMSGVIVNLVLFHYFFSQRSSRLVLFFAIFLFIIMSISSFSRSGIFFYLMLIFILSILSGLINLRNLITLTMCIAVALLASFVFKEHSTFWSMFYRLISDFLSYLSVAPLLFDVFELRNIPNTFPYSWLGYPSWWSGFKIGFTYAGPSSFPVELISEKFFFGYNVLGYPIFGNVYYSFPAFAYHEGGLINVFLTTIFSYLMIYFVQRFNMILGLYLIFYYSFYGLHFMPHYRDHLYFVVIGFLIFMLIGRRMRIEIS